MKWSTLIGLLVAALGIGILCCCGPHSIGPGLRDIHNPMDFWPRQIHLALDGFGALLLLLSCFLYRGRNWARLMLMGGCTCFSILALVGAAALGVFDAGIPDVVYLAGLLIWSVAGPVFLVLVLRRPEAAKEFGSA